MCNRICLGMKTLICKYFEYPGGCVRGDKCFYAHGEQELRPTKHGTKWFHFRTAELRRKIFVGGLPPSVGSGWELFITLCNIHDFRNQDLSEK